MGEKVRSSREDEKRLPLSMQILPVGKDPILELAKRHNNKRRPEKEARRQGRKVQERGRDHKEQIQADTRRPELVQRALHRRHEQRVQEVRRVREGAPRLLRAEVRQAALASQHLRQDEYRRDLLGNADYGEADEPGSRSHQLVEGLRLGHAHELASVRGVLGGAQDDCARLQGQVYQGGREQWRRPYDLY